MTDLDQTLHSDIDDGLSRGAKGHVNDGVDVSVFSASEGGPLHAELRSRPILSVGEYIKRDFAATRDMDPTRPHGLGRTLDIISQAGFLSLALYRVCAAVHRSGHRLLARLLLNLNVVIFNCEIYPQTVIGPGATITHPLGVAIGAGVVMGEGVRIHGLVRIGTAGYEGRKVDGFPAIGDDCRLFDHAMLFGPIEIGARSKIGANVLLLQSVPEDSVVVAPQGIVLDKSSSD